MDIICSANNNEEIMIMPVVPEDLPEIEKSYNNTSMTTLYGELNLIGVKGLRQLTLESFLPCSKRPYMRPGSSMDYEAYIKFFERWADAQKPIRVVMVDTNREILNMAAAVQSFSWKVKRNGDISYSLVLKEFAFVKVRRLSQ